MKRFLILLAALALAASIVTAQEAGNEAANSDSTDAAKAEATEQVKPLAEMDGQELYRHTCKSCHAADSPNGEYTPMSLIMDQWDEVFDGFAESHAEVKLEKLGDEPLPEILTDEMLSRMRKFCIDHAADSEQPMTCG